MKKALVIGICLCMAFFAVAPVTVLLAQTEELEGGNQGEVLSTAPAEDASSTALLLQEKAQQASVKDITQPENLPEKAAIISMFAAREVPTLDNPFAFMAYAVQRAVQMGIPANTIFLILLTPLLATIVSFVRIVIGLPTLDLIVPIALSFVFIAVGVTVGLLVLGGVVLASYLSKVVLSRVRIMFYPKRSLSFFFLALFVFMVLTLAVMFGFDQVLNVSIFPILILMLLGDSIVTIQLSKSKSETTVITSTTIGVGLIGFILATNDAVRNALILYPELVLLALPLNLLIGRYFGLRLTEFFRFNTLSN